MSGPECHARAKHDQTTVMIPLLRGRYTTQLRWDLILEGPGRSRSPCSEAPISVFIDCRILITVCYSAPIAVRIAAANAPCPAAVG